MRIGMVLASVLGLISPAAAENARYLPAVGTTATYRVLVTAGSGSSEQTLGQVYRVKITAADATMAQGQLTPLALVWRCPAGDKSIGCQQAQNVPNFSRDGDLITVALPADVSSGLAKIGRLTIRDFLNVTQVLPIPGLQDMSEIAKPRLGTTPIMVQTTTTDCDEAALKPFFPFGAVAKATVLCKVTNETSQSRFASIKDGKTTYNATYDLSFAGREHVAVPAGTYEVAVIKFKATSDTGPASEGEWEFVQDLGISAKFSSIIRFPNSTTTTRAVRELIKVEP